MFLHALIEGFEGSIWRAVRVRLLLFGDLGLDFTFHFEGIDAFLKMLQKLEYHVGFGEQID